MWMEVKEIQVNQAEGYVCLCFGPQATKVNIKTAMGQKRFLKCIWEQ